MRIYNGSYELNPGISFHSPKRFYDYKVTEKEVIIYALCLEGYIAEKINGRILRYFISSPFPDVLRVQIRYFRPSEIMKFKTATATETLQVEDDDESILIKSGRLGIEFKKNEWEYSYVSDSILATSGRESAGIVFDENSQHHITEKLSIGVGDLVYGMGERYCPFIKNGQHIEIFNADAATESDMGYKNIPFYMTNNGYGVFVNTPAPVDFEICTEDAHAVRITVPLQELDYYVLYGPDPKKVISQYTALTGRPPLIPKWSFGLWLTTSFTTEYNEEVITEHIKGMFDRKIPLTVFHFDCYWMKERHWCNSVSYTHLTLPTN